MDARDLENAAWRAYATMINQAQALEAAAAQLRRDASVLHTVLDPAPDFDHPKPRERRGPLGID